MQPTLADTRDVLYDLFEGYMKLKVERRDRDAADKLNISVIYFKLSS